MIKPRCPDPEQFALLIENRIGRVARGRILRHAADCVSCRRQLAIASLSPLGPLRAALERHLSSGGIAVGAGLILGIVALAVLNSGDSSDEAPRRAARPSRPAARAARAPSVAEAPLARAEEVLPYPPPEASPPKGEDRPAVSAPDEGPIPSEVAAPPAAAAPAPAASDGPHPQDAVAEGFVPAPAEPRTAESDAMGRLAILDPFGGLALEGAGGRLPVLGSRVIPIEARLTAVGKASGFRLGDGLRVQLAAGSAVSVFQNLTRRCAGLSVLQGALLLESSQPQSLYLRRDGNSGTLEGMNGPMLVSAGAKAGSLSLTPAGPGPVVWKGTGLAALEIASGETAGVDASGPEVGGKAAKARPSLARFVGWPEPSSLFYSSFDDGVQGVERPVVVQGAAREGYVAGAPGTKGRRTIEITLPASVQSVPVDATVRLRVRTTALRIQCSVGPNSSRSVPVTVTQRNRSDTAWTTVSIALSAFDQDAHRGRRGFRGNLTFTAEGPSRLSADDLVFDLDEIEISRS